MNPGIFALRLKTSRIQKNLSKRELSEQTGISQALLSRYESESNTSFPNAISVYTLSKALNVSCAYLLGTEERTNISPVVPSKQKISLKRIENYTTLESARRFDFVRMPVEYPGDFFITMEDHSMHPLFSRRDILFFKTCKQLKDQAIVLFRARNSEENIVRLCSVTDKVELKALNEDYKSFRVDSEIFFEQYNILGYLSGYWVKLKQP